MRSDLAIALLREAMAGADTVYAMTCMDCGEAYATTTVPKSTGLCAPCLALRLGDDNRIPPDEASEHEDTTARGILHGLALSTALWGLIALLLWATAQLGATQP